MTEPWVAIVPQKRLADAKSRLDLPAGDRRLLAAAMLEDTVTALSRVEQLHLVIIAWEDPTDRPRQRLPDKVVHVAVARTDLNGAISKVEQQLTESLPRSGRLVVPGDLPACSHDQVADLIAQAAVVPRSFLRDIPGSGTTILAAHGTTRLSPRYGRGSASEHAASGAQPLDPGPFSSLSRDVDTLADLQAALRLYVGPATLSVARALNLSEHRPGVQSRTQISGD
jgi:2-phospho-L-lactate guanylyltransferase